MVAAPTAGGWKVEDGRAATGPNPRPLPWREGELVIDVDVRSDFWRGYRRLMSAGTIVLWDIDNTLLYTGGAGSLAMARAFCDLYGIEDAFRKVEFSGRTDTAIFSDAAREHGIDETAIPVEIERFMDAYLSHLGETLVEVIGRTPDAGRSSRSSSALDVRADVVQGLGTGNFRRGGEMKLRYYGIDAYFPSMAGGFGEDSEDRNVVIAHGIERLRDGGTGRGWS